MGSEGIPCLKPSSLFIAEVKFELRTSWIIAHSLSPASLPHYSCFWASIFRRKLSLPWHTLTIFQGKLAVNEVMFVPETVILES